MIVVGQVGQFDQSSTRRFVLLDQEYHACQNKPVENMPRWLSQPCSPHCYSCFYLGTLVSGVDNHHDAL